MTLAAGTKLGPYGILTPPGAGGMGDRQSPGLWQTSPPSLLRRFGATSDDK